MLRKIFGRPDVKETVKKSKTDIRKGVRGEFVFFFPGVGGRASASASSRPRLTPPHPSTSPRNPK